MNIKDCTKTVGGYPYRFYADDGGGPRPIHGAYYKEKYGWVADTWNRRGEKYQNYGMAHELDLDLDLRDWKDKIPWDRLADEIVVVTWDSYRGFRGYSHEPKRCFKSCFWLCLTGGVWSLDCVKMPQPPDSWKEAIARRPE